jgi:predicted dehydrogenase
MDLRLGIVGLGMRGPLFALANRPGEGSRVVAVCDRDPARLAAYGADPAGSSASGGDLLLGRELDELLALDPPLDGIGIFTPDHTHAGLARRCLAAGVATFLEKPMAISTADADSILDSALTHRTPLYVGHNMRHLPMVRLMKRLIDDGGIGEVKAVWCRHFVGYGGDYYFKDWHAERRYTNSLLLQKGSHDIDVIHWLAGSRTRRTNAVGALTLYDKVTDRHDGSGPSQPVAGNLDNWPPLAQRELSPRLDVEDLSQVNLVLDNGVLASYQQCHYTPDYWRNYTVIGTEGRLENFGDFEDPVVKVWNRRTTFGEADRVLRVSDVDDDAGHDGTPHGGADPRIVAEFLAMIRDGTRPVISPVEARDAVAAACAATESLRSGGVPVDVPPVRPEVAAYFMAH